MKRSFRGWTLPLLMAAVILALGSSYFSLARTGSVIEPILRRLLRNPNSQSLFFWHSVIRWSAHFVEYGLLSFALIAGPFRRRPVTVLLICLAVAGLDEGLQRFWPNRSSNLFEVTLDVGGAASVLLVALPVWMSPRGSAAGSVCERSADPAEGERDVVQRRQVRR